MMDGMIPVLFFALAPIFFAPVISDFYDSAKWFLLVYVCLITVAGWAWMTICKSPRASTSLSPSAITLAVLSLAGFISLFTASPNKIEALTHPLGPVTFAALAILSFIAPTYWHEGARKSFLWILGGGVSFLGILAVYQFLGMGRVMFPSVPFLTDSLWTPTGSTVATATLLGMTLPLFILQAKAAWKHKHESRLVVFSLMSIVVLAGLAVTLWQLVPRITGTLLPLSQGWAMMLDILKSPKQAMVGVGTENFLAAFSAARPASFNVTPLWSVRFTLSSSWVFHFITVWGLPGLLGMGLLLKNLLGKHRHASSEPGISLALVLGAIALLITPPNVSVLIVLAGLLIYSESASHPIHSHTMKNAPRIIFLVFAGVILISGFYGTSRALVAERLFYRSLKAAQDNNGTQTYNLQVAAIKTNPGVSRYRIIYSQTNLALATSLAGSLAERNEASSEAILQDRNLVTQLVSQSIREAKAAVSLNPLNILAWENLARIYEQLIGVAQGADSWAITTLGEAIKRDPVNPVLPLELGSIYLRMKDYPKAIAQFDRATKLKPNYANAWYNLGNAYRINGDDIQALSALEQAQKFVTPGSDDARIVAQELDALRNPSLPAPTATPTPTPVLSPPLDIPNQ